MRNERGITLISLLLVLAILAILISTCYIGFHYAPPPGPALTGITIGATPTTLTPGGTTTVAITVTLDAPAAAPGQTVYVRVLEADYFGDDLLYRMQPVFVPFGSTVGVAAVVLECDSGDHRLRAPLGSGQNDYSDPEDPWDVRVLPYYGRNPRSSDVQLRCTGG